MMKKILLLFTVLLLTAGGGQLWADTTHELILNSGATEKTNGGNAVEVPQGEQSTCYFKIIDTSASPYNYNSKYNGYYEGVHYTKGLKIQSNTKLYFTTSSIATVTIVQATKADNIDNNNGIKFGISGNTTSYAYTDAVTPSEVSATTERVRVYTFANQAAGSYAIEQNGGESGLFYVRVVESGKNAPSFSFADHSNVNMRIAFNESNGTYTRTISTNTSNGTVTYSINDNPAGATINSSTGRVTATAAGTYVIHAAVSETESYTAAYDEYTLIVTKGSSTFSGPDTYTQSYPYTWDFSTSGSQWATSQTQMTSTYGDWGGDGTYYHQSYPDAYSTYPIGFNIAVIKGLRFSHNYLGLDWGYGHIWYAGGGSITIPGLVTGQTVTFLMDGRGDGATTVMAPNTSGSSYSVSSTGTHQEYTYTVTSSGDIVFTFDKNISIRSIAVSAAPTRNTFVWNFAKPISTIDQKLLNGEKTEWNLDDGHWKHTGGDADNTPFAQNDKELEHVYGLSAKIPSSDSNTLIYTNSGGLRLNNGGDNRYLCIPSLKAGDKVTVLCNNYSKDRGINLPDNIVNNSTAKGWGEYSSTGEFTCEGYVEADGNVLLKPTSALDIKTITVESSNKPWPTTLSFEKCAASATVNVKIPYGASTATYTNTLVAPEGCGAVSYGVLLGNATVDANGVVTINAAGEVIVRATTAGGDNYSAYYCDYIINATETEFTEYNPSANTYEWRFYDVNWWVTESSQLDTSNSKWWYLDDGYYKYKQNDGNLSNASLVTTSPTPLPETNNLTFTATKGRVGIKIGSELFLGPGAQITLPSLIAGARVTVRANAHTSNKTLTVANGSESSFNLTTATQDFTFTVSSAGQVSLTNNSDDYMRIYAIVVEKPEFTFSEYKTTYWDGTTTTETKTVPYKADGDHKFSVGANVPSGASLTWDNFTISSSNTSVVSATLSSTNFSYDTENDKVWFSNLVTGDAGTAVLTFTFNGNSNYASKSFTVTLNVVTGDPALVYTNNDKGTETVAYADKDSWAGNALTYSTGLTTSDITFSSNDTHVANVASDGTVTINNAGTAVIRAKFAGDSHYNAAETYYTLHVTGTASSETLSWIPTTQDPATPGTGFTKAKGTNTFTYTATSSGSSKVNYKSSNSAVVSVTPEGVISFNTPGTAVITAYTDGTEGNEGAELSYTVTVTGGSISISFEPSSGKVTKDCVIMPRLSIPSLERSEITSLTLSVASGDEQYVSIPSNLLVNDYLEMQGTVVSRVYPRIKGIKATTEGSPVTITASFQSPYYNNGQTVTATYQLTVTESTDLFSWKRYDDVDAKTEYTLVEGELMMMPTISGTANGNIDGLSKGTVNQARHGYLYAIEGDNRTLTWNRNDYYWGEGVPDYTLTPTSVGGGVAYIVSVNGYDTDHPALMIYGESAGDLILRATDSQTGYSAGDITIHVVSKSDCVKAQETSFWADKKFPFTWDFTNISPSDVTDDVVHWKNHYHGTSNTPQQMDPMGGQAVDTGGHIMGMAASLDYDYGNEADDDKAQVKPGVSGGAESSRYPRIIRKWITNGETNNNKVMPAFHGIRVALANHQQGKFTNKTDKVFFEEKGGTVDKGNCSHMDVHILSGEHDLAANGEENVLQEIAKEEVITVGEKKIYSFDIPASIAGKIIRLGFDQNVDVYWIALSTEANNTVKPDQNTHLEGAATTYSYSKALDLAKSEEANSGLKAYYASSFSNGDGVASTVILRQVTYGDGAQNSVPANTGLVLKSNDVSTNYMIAFAENKEDDTVPDALDKNYLVASNGSSVSSTTGTGENIKTNFVLSYAYKKFSDTGEALTGYQYDRDWSFYKIIPFATLLPGKAYLQVPGNLRVKTDGTIETVTPSASRRAADDSDDRPANKAMLDIVYEDEAHGFDGTTAINVINGNVRVANDGWYTLQGIRVDAPTKGGIYIHNGRKVVIK